MDQGEIADAVADYALRTARWIVDSFGPRPPASEGERRAQEFLRGELEPVADGAVAIESFSVAAKAFLAVPPVTGLLVAGAIAGWWVSPWLALAMSSAAMLILVGEVGRYRQLIDPVFPKGTSYNVLGRQRPSGKIARRLVLNAHPDAAYEWRWHYLLPRVFPLIIYYGFATITIPFFVDVVAVALEFAGALGPRSRVAMGLVQLVFAPGALIGITFTSFRRVSPGANDNLSGALIVVGLAKHLRAGGRRLENTELVYLITGSEEAGLRGAKAFTRRHAGDFDDVPTVVVTLDTIRDLAHLHVYDRDRNGTVRHDPAACRWLRDAGRRRGRDIGYASVHLGSTDAAAFTLAGMSAAALCAMDPHPADYYHNRRDHPDNMSRECLRETTAILLEAIDRYDRHGLGAVEE